MNSDQERPYVCNAPGCSQRFPTEDHLMIHRHKHEMTLKFPSIKNDNMLSDQTPTPTRFLKNCEEVGLFSELDCSIEQEFCKAQEEEDSKQVLQSGEQSLRLKDRGEPCVTQRGWLGQVVMNCYLPLPSSRGARPALVVPRPTLPRSPSVLLTLTDRAGSIVIQQALPSPQSSSVITQAGPGPFVILLHAEQCVCGAGDSCFAVHPVLSHSRACQRGSQRTR
uniref:cAMP responsive element binding protein 5 n=1 Tax=Cyclopterus lumpus TaxID=8103 RepID=A0A8C2XBA7_CYCLU